MCQVHFSRAVLKNIPNKEKEVVAEKLKESASGRKQDAGTRSRTQPKKTFEFG